MKKEDRIRESFSPLLDGELPDEEREAIEEELADESELLRELDSFRQVDAAYRSLAQHETPDSFMDSVHAAIEERSAFQSRRRHLVRTFAPILAVAALVLIVAGVVLIPRSKPVQLAKSEQADQSAKALEPAPKQAEEDLMQTTQGFHRNNNNESGPATTQKALESSLVRPGQSAKALSAPPSKAPPLELNKTVAERQPQAKGGSDVATTAKGVSAPNQTGDGLGGGIGGVQTGGGASQGNIVQSAPAPAAPAPQSAPAAKSKTTLADASKPRIYNYFSSTQAAPPLLSVTIGDHVFRLREGTWYEAGYDKQHTQTIARDARELTQWFPEETARKALLALDKPVVFRHENTWYRLEPARSK